jgi:Na+-transporting NADH:ubiquinone oxidoreductase subunit NqrE
MNVGYMWIPVILFGAGMLVSWMLSTVAMVRVEDAQK